MDSPACPAGPGPGAFTEADSVTGDPGGGGGHCDGCGRRRPSHSVRASQAGSGLSMRLTVFSPGSVSAGGRRAESESEGRQPQSSSDLNLKLPLVHGPQLLP
jgi:hypothetical protein